MAAVTICSDFGAPKNKVWHCFPIYLPWSDGTGCYDLFSECWALSQLFHSSLSLSSRGSLVLHFLHKGGVKIPLDYWTLFVFLCVMFFYARLWPGYSLSGTPAGSTLYSPPPVIISLHCLVFHILKSLPHIFLSIFCLLVFVASLKLNLVFCDYILDRRVNLL